MIVKMLKVYVAAASQRRDDLLAALGELGVVHLAPVDPDKAVAEEKTLADTDAAVRAMQILSSVEPAGAKPEISAEAAAKEAVSIQRRSAEAANRLSSLHRQIESLAMWGDVRLDQFEQLRQAGVDVKFFSVPSNNAPLVHADCVQTLADLPGKRVLMAVIDRGGGVSLPEQVEPIPLPPRDRPTIREEAAQIDAALATDRKRLSQLTHLAVEIESWRGRLASDAEYTIAGRGALSGEHLFAVQGWTPADKAESLAADLATAGIEAAVETFEPAEDEEPPTLIRYPKWTRPIKGLFDIMGTNPGYRELDLSGFFMIGLPVFTGMLIGDAGYGLMLIAIPLLMYRRVTAAAGRDKIHLLMVMGAATFVWGLLTGNIFGVTPQNMIDAGGPVAVLGTGLSWAHFIAEGNQKDVARGLMQVSFIFGTIHLVTAQVRQSLGVFPGLRFLSHIGWSLFLCGMLGIIWFLFFDSQKTPPVPINPVVPWLLGAGGALAVLFANPDRNIAKMLGLGLANFPLDAIGAFSNTISYIRLMAVGLSSTIIAQTTNSLAYDLAGAATWIPGALVILFGHTLNIALCAIAVLAHGVRLNMLEFSTNAGVQWRGYDYKPFAGTKYRES